MISALLLSSLAHLFLQAPPEQGLVTLEAEHLPLTEVLALVSKQTGETFEIDPALSNARVTLTLDRASFFDATDAICRSHGDAHAIFQTFTRTILIRKGPYIPYPRSASGPHQFRILAVAVRRESRFDGAPERHTMLDLEFAWTRTADLHSLLGAPVVTSAADNTGLSLLTAGTPDAPTQTRERVQGRPEIARRWSLNLGLPAPEAAHLAAIEGFMTVSQVDQWANVTIADPKDGAETAPESTPLKFSIRNYAHDEGIGGAVLEIAHAGGFPEEEYADVSAVERLDHLRILDAAGREHPVLIMTALSRPEFASIELQWRGLPADFTIKELRLNYALKLSERKIPFEFRDVPLP